MKSHPSPDYLNSILKSLPDPMFIYSESGKYVDVLGGGDKRYYHDGTSLIGLSIFDVIEKERADWFHQQIKIALHQGDLHIIEYSLSNKEIDGMEDSEGPRQDIYFEAKIIPLDQCIDGERTVLWVARNITQRRKLEVKLREQSERDSLTGVFNRRKFTKELEKELLLANHSVSLVMYDIDFLKNINDTYGHDVGDKVLCLVSDVVKCVICDSDILARIGGDEFMILMKNTSKQQAKNIADKLVQAIKGCDFGLCSYPSTPTISVGIAYTENNDSSSGEILKRVDDALYKAKNNGRNQIMVD